jgi:hypothetical protein
MPLVLAGATSGSTTIQATDAVTQTITLPNNTGTVLTTASTFGGTGPAFGVYSTVNQSTATGTFTKIQLNTERFDTNSNFDSTTNYRFTPTVAGYYQISSGVSFSAPSNNYGVGAVIYKNGSAYAWGTAVGTTQMYPTATASSLIYFNGSTDYIELYVYNGTPVSAATVGDTYYTYMTGFLARSA